MTNTILTTLSPQRLKQHYEEGFWQSDTIYMLARKNAQAHPDHYALRDRYRRLTFAQAVEAADRLAAHLAAQGVRRGQRVAVWLSSRLETAIALLACSRNGYVCCPSLHRNHTVGEIGELMERMRAAALVAEIGYGADADRHDVFALAEAQKTMRAIYRVPALAPGDAQHLPFGPLLATGAGAADATPFDTEPDTLVYLAFTSGTTGKPKGVMHSDNTLLANARALAGDWSLGPGSVIYTLSPLSHNLGFGAMVAAFAVGAELVVHDTQRGESLAERLAETGATFMFGVPVHAIDLLKELRERDAALVKTVKGFRISGAPVPQEVAAELLQYGVVPQSGYGMTEACSHHYTLPTDDPKMIIETSGRSCPGYEIRIFTRDDPEKEAPVGEVGQIGGRGASLMLGYYDNQEATEDSFNAQGWFMTGDLGWVDAEGYLRITGRKKDVIIRGGHNIYPAKIEALAGRHAAVERAAAVPVADERMGEKVCLVLMPRAGKLVDPMDMLAHLDATGLSKFDMPEYMVLVDDIPLTASGKILKRDLVDQIKAGTLVPQPVRWAGPKASAAVAEAVQ
ncbi:MAG TPA: class I adenylate-forming enzyme family protein [Noviherbaspirillum sp.]|nr:class I adenylate-forming enzyme family protein [Noviherbaspirillum sp.]